MASIQKEIEQISKASYGEQVRKSICDGLQKINDDNNSYNELKETVLETARDIDETAKQAQSTLDKFEKDIETTQSVIDEFEGAAKKAQQLKEDLDNAFNKVVDATDVLERSRETRDLLESENTKAEGFLEQFDNSNDLIIALQEKIDQLDLQLKELLSKKDSIKDQIEESQKVIEKLETIINDAGLIDLVSLTNRMTAMENAVYKTQRDLMESI